MRIFLLPLLLYACDHPLQIAGEGDIVSASGQRSCSLEQQPCPNLVVGEYKETYSGKPRPGWVFTHWDGCGTQFPDCTLNVPADVVQGFWFKQVTPLIAGFTRLAKFVLSEAPVADYSGIDVAAFVRVAAVMDLNNDGYNDLLFAGPKWKNKSYVLETVPFEVMLNDRNSGFKQDSDSILANGESIPALVHANDYAVADFNGDGFDDLVVVGAGLGAEPFNGERNVLLLSNAAGKYRDVKINDPDFNYQGFSSSVTAADIDLDNDVDIVVTDIAGKDFNCEYSVRILTNDGDANFTLRADWYPGTGPCQVYFSSRLADLNNNGYPDLVLGRHDISRDTVLWNDGTGNYANGAMPPLKFSQVPGLEWTADVRAFDVNSDGYLDILFSRSGTAAVDLKGRMIQVLVNQRDGSFKDETTRYFPNISTTDSGWGQNLYASDINKDGKVDLVARYDLPFRAPSKLFAFYKLANDSYRAYPSDEHFGLVLIDADRDGDDDLLVFQQLNWGIDSYQLNWDLAVNQTE